MLLVVADTSPIRYLVEIGHIGLLPQLFERIFIPSLVYDELRHPSAPAAVRAWTNSLPAWLARGVAGYHERRSGVSGFGRRRKVGPYAERVRRPRVPVIWNPIPLPSGTVR
jgi:hypothetical protein